MGDGIESSAGGAASNGASMPGGVFITFEGGDGAGKSTHMRFLADQLVKQGFEVLQLREPGGTAVGEQLRGIVLDPVNDDIADECELFIYEAARAQLVSRVIKPALSRGAVVICDRFADSTVAYQSFGRGLDRAAVKAANEFACQGVRPQRTVFMTTGDALVGLARAKEDHAADRLELAGADFHQRVARGYAELAEADPERFRVVFTAEKRSDTARAVFRQVADLFPVFDLASVSFDSLDEVEDSH